jgi:hypothetical protein
VTAKNEMYVSASERQIKDLGTNCGTYALEIGDWRFLIYDWGLGIG